MLWARAGRTYCPNCNLHVERDTVDQVAAKLSQLPIASRWYALFPLPPEKKKDLSDELRDRLFDLRKRGFTRLFQNNQVFEFSTPESLLEIDFRKPTFVLVDRLAITDNMRQRVVDTLEICYRESGEAIFQSAAGDEALRFNERFECKKCGKQFTALASLVPGVTITGSNGALTQDVGGSSGMAFAMATIHGGKQDDQTVHINGMSVASLTSIGNSRTNIQDGNVEEYSMQLASQAAEFAYGGIYVNVIPKEGGNTFRGRFFSNFAIMKGGIFFAVFAIVGSCGYSPQYPLRRALLTFTSRMVWSVSLVDQVTGRQTEQTAELVSTVPIVDAQLVRSRRNSVAATYRILHLMKRVCLSRGRCLERASLLGISI